MTSKRGSGRKGPPRSDNLDIEEAFGDEGTPTGKSAREKMADLLARADHSELELRRKLSRSFEPDEVEDAIQFAKERKFLLAPEELSERVAASLGAKKKKGVGYINQFLESKGLPPVATDPSEEVRKGLELACSKLAKQGPFDYEEQRKIQRLLANRGYDDETIRNVIRAANGRADDLDAFEAEAEDHSE